MGDFISNPNATIPGPKRAGSALPSNRDPDIRIRAQDYNAIRDALLDLRASLLAGMAIAPGAGFISGIWVGDSPPAVAVTRAQWLSDGIGYWGWFDTSVQGVSLVSPCSDLSLVTAVPIMRIGINPVYAFVDTFSDGLLDPNAWAAVVAGGGSVVETTSLRLNSSGSAAQAAFVYMLAPVLKETRTFTAKWRCASAAVGATSYVFSIAQSPTAPVAEAWGLAKFRIIFQHNAYWGSISYVNTTPANIVVAPESGFADLAAGTLYRLVLETTATTWRLRVYVDSDSTLKEDSGIQNWASVYDTMDPLWLVLGDRWTSDHSDDSTFTSFQKA